MRNYEIEDNMYRKAVELIEKRYPAGWGGAGVVHTSQGNDYTSVSIDTANASAVVCIELGAMLEAHKYNEKVILRTDAKTQMENLASAVNNGIYTANEAREYLDFRRRMEAIS